MVQGQPKILQRLLELHYGGGVAGGVAWRVRRVTSLPTVGGGLLIHVAGQLELPNTSRPARTFSHSLVLGWDREGRQYVHNDILH